MAARTGMRLHRLVCDMPSNFRKLMPTVLRPFVVFDSFNRANGALGYTATGQAWSSVSGTHAIVSNAAKGTTKNTSNYAVVNSGQSNCAVSATITFNESQNNPPNATTWLTLRNDGTINNRMSLQFVSGEISINRNIAGASTNLATVSNTYGLGTFSVRFAAVGNVFKGYINGSEVISATDDNALKSGKYHCGFQFYNAQNVPTSTIDNFSVEAL